MLYDILFTLDAQGRFCGVSWGNREAEDLYRDLFESWAGSGRMANTAFDLPEGASSGQFIWEESAFSFQILPAPENTRWLLLKRVDQRPYLLARALDQIADGVQIYDKNACAVFFNRASRGISRIPSGVNIEGRHLLDLYNLDESVSTTMTALQTQAPVIDRVDSFRANDFSTAPIASANTSYPIFREGELLGAVVFEQTAEIVERNMKKMEATGKALSAFSQRPPKISFSGYTFDNVIGSCPKLREAVELARRVAPQDSPILLVGETGTGKEIFAQSIHRSSRRRGGKFLAINCAAVPETLIESLLFGTKRGSFTGSEDKAGYLATISQGTWMESSYAQMAEQLRDPEEVSFYLQSPEAPPRYRAVWNAYIAKRYAIAGERRIIAGMREKTLQAMEGRNVTVYRLCKDLGLNKGNIYAFLGKGDDTKVSQGTARRILEYACKAS